MPGVEVFGADPSSALVSMIGSNSLLSETFESSLTGSVNVWTPVTRFFVVDSALSTLTFASNDGAAGYYGGIQIDSVSVEAVPDPTSLALAALAVLGLLHIRRRRFA